MLHDDPQPIMERPVPQPPKPSWFQVAGDVDDFIFYFEDPSACSQR
ncbi:MAG: hypothetical protein IKD34_03835 [Oscillospiraceae bacterium]|nr:hypothetical protein [Oscillospiraceae bacterium]MBQ3241810.1 hypothetical protein [Oscillospiraceae bacterium]MBR2636160.1 hypothetical protein [Oscillospiraceae bacterium]